MVYKHIPQIESVLKVLFRNGIQSNEQVFSLTDDKIQNIRGLGVKKIEAVKQLQALDTEEDFFKEYRSDYLKPRRMAKFFNDLHITSENIIQTKLHKLDKKTRLTNGRIEAFLEFKHECLRHQYNDSLESTVSQTEDDIVLALSQLFLHPLKPYLVEEQFQQVKSEVEKLIANVQFVNVDIDCYGTEINRVLDYEFFLGKYLNDFARDILHKIILKQRKEINLFQLKQKVNDIGIFDVADVDQHLQALLNDGFIMYTSHGIKYNQPKVAHFIDRNIDSFRIVNERLNGKTLEAIGLDRDVTRERIRQLEAREVANIPFKQLYEWRFVPFYQKYDLSEEEFCQVFQIDGKQYLFLKLYHSTDQLKEKLSKEELLESQTLSLKEQEELLKVINKDYLVLDNRRIKKNKISIVTYCVEKFAKETIRIDDFVSLVIQFCKDYNLDLDFSSARALEGILVRVDPLLWKYGRQFRYYGIDKEQIKETLSKINFNRYHNQEISAAKVLRDYFDEFSEIDILDEYELHNLFKKYEHLIPNNVTLRRMPLLEVGEANREEQLLDLLIEHSPILKDHFASLYYEKYGVLVQTVKANYLPILREYENGESLNADTPVVPEEVIDRLQKILTKDFYFKEDIYDEYRKQHGEERLPDYIFKQMGYRNFSEFILKDTYSRADVYFEEKYFRNDIFEIEDTRLMYLGSFRNKLNQLRENMDIFEYDKNVFIRFEKIHDKTGIEKSDITELMQTIMDEVGDKYFTVDIIQPIIERSVLNRLGFDDIFYESILRGNNQLRFQYMGSKVVFRRTREKFYIYNLIEETVSRFKKIDIYDLISYLDETYYISLPKETIIQCTEMTNLYYHPVMEMMFQDIDEFYEMMEAD